MNAFSPNYVPVIDWTKNKQAGQISRRTTSIRNEKLASADPKLRAQASGTMPHLAVSLNPKLRKNSRIG